MSEPKLISPLLDGFSMGNPVSEHNGIRCCPAIKENTDKKYIVKIISIPPTQAQMDALLLAGAYKDPADAMEYFKRMGEDLMKEAEFLKQLSRLNGFLSYENWQMAPITRKRLGYEVYLVSSYKRTLENFVRQTPVTHLEAVNLALDLCSALSVSREAGAIYVDLKPSNIFVSEKKEYRIGDLGFVQLDALSYSSLPEKYQSVYTPPELFDPMSPVNLSADTYAVGMILYQLYNDGYLPFKDKSPEEPLPSPINADYELAEIIMKAIHPDPAQRWKHPKDLGKAIATYMQKNAVNDVPITPYTPLDVAPEDVMLVKKPAAEPENTIENQELAETDAVPAEAHQETEENPPESTGNMQAASEDMQEETATLISEEVPNDEEVPSELSEELSKIISKADDLIEHKVPEGVVLPAIPDTPDPFAFAAEVSKEIDDSDIPVDPVMEQPDEQSRQEIKRGGRFGSAKNQKKLKKFFSKVLLFLVIAAICGAAYGFYQFFYLQTIDDLIVVGSKDALTVSVSADIDPAQLTVICSDTYGNSKVSKIENGRAVFSDLIPNTMYAIRLEVEGFHKLVGKTSGHYTTDATTNIVSFSAVTGAEDGSVLLTFTVTGEEPEVWSIDYQAEGEEPLRETFSGHSLSLEGLSIGKVYTFTLDAGGDKSLSGQTELQFMPSRLILAENIRVTSNGGNDMTVHWKAPGDIVVDSWDVRCYNETGFEQQMNVSNTEVYFAGIDLSSGYTIEVTAAGMTKPVRVTVTPDPVLVTDWTITPTEAGELEITWQYTGGEPTGNWLLTYSMDGGNTSNVIKSAKPHAVIPASIPGVKYQLTLETTDNLSVLNNTESYTCPEAPAFAEHNLSAEAVTMLMMETPEDGNWDYAVFEEEKDQTFPVGQKLSLALHADADFYRPGNEVEVLFVIWDSYENVRPEWISIKQMFWKDIWEVQNYRYALLDIPKLPEYPGTYTIQLMVDGQLMGETEFTISE